MEELSILNGFIPNTLTNCSFIDCHSDYYGGAFSADMSGDYITIYRCTFVNCTAAECGGAVSTFKGAVSVEYSVFIGNSASLGGNDFYIESGRLQINEGVFTDKNSLANSIDMVGRDDLLNGTMHYSTDYNSASCTTAFSALAPDGDGNCAMPCAASGSTCVKPDACSSGSLAVNGKCIANSCSASCGLPIPTGFCGNIIPFCPLRVPNENATYPCGEVCYQQMGADGLNNNICATDCEHGVLTGNKCSFPTTGCASRMADTYFTLPCGVGCFQQVDNNYFMISSCRADCPSHLPYITVGNGKCLPSDCSARTANTSSKLACGPSCYNLSTGACGDFAAYCGESGATPSQDQELVCVAAAKGAEKEKKKLTKAMKVILIIAGSGVGALAIVAVVVVSIVCYGRRKRQEETDVPMMEWSSSS